MRQTTDTIVGFSSTPSIYRARTGVMKLVLTASMVHGRSAGPKNLGPSRGPAHEDVGRP